MLLISSLHKRPIPSPAQELFGQIIMGLEYLSFSISYYGNRKIKKPFSKLDFGNGLIRGSLFLFLVGFQLHSINLAHNGIRFWIIAFYNKVSVLIKIPERGFAVLGIDIIPVL